MLDLGPFHPNGGFPDPEAAPPVRPGRGPGAPLSCPASLFPSDAPMTRRMSPWWCGAVLLTALGITPAAQIKSYTLEEMVQVADDAVYGQIVGSRVTRVDHPLDGAEFYYTTITVQGRSLASSRPATVDVTFRGGFLGETEGVFNSEAPAADDVKLGKHVVAFYRWSDDMGGGVPANALVAAHGGLYRVVEGPSGAAVLGRGEGYAIRANLRLAELESALRQVRRR